MSASFRFSAGKSYINPATPLHSKHNATRRRQYWIWTRAVGTYRDNGSCGNAGMICITNLLRYWSCIFLLLIYAFTAFNCSDFSIKHYEKRHLYILLLGRKWIVSVLLDINEIVLKNVSRMLDGKVISRFFARTLQACIVHLLCMRLLCSKKHERCLLS